MEQELSRGGDPSLLLQEILNAVNRVGERFRDGPLFVSEVLISALAAKREIEVLEPLLREKAASEDRVRGKVILGTPPGDLHDIGKMLLAIAVSR